MTVAMKFRPQNLSRRYAAKFRREHGACQFNWRSRVIWHPVGWQINQISIARTFARLHYLACHAPAAVQQRWRPAYLKFCQQHFTSINRTVSMRYTNRYSCHSWL